MILTPEPLHLLIAFALDLVIGDPLKLPHPVQLIARIATTFERMTRATSLPLRLVGLLTWMGTMSSVLAILWYLGFVAGFAHPLLAEVLTIYLIFSGLAVGSLRNHVMAVYHKLRVEDLVGAREALSKIVGRDTHALDEPGVVRGAVESVGESFVDGILAPLFFLGLAGPVGMWCYKTMNTMDSLFGYRNVRYVDFGWTAARMDDLATFFPARLSALCLLPAALFYGRLAQSWRVFLRDRLKHPSPNSAHGEALLAGALGIQLGGTSSYKGVLSHKPLLGDPEQVPTGDHILRAIRLMLIASLIALGLLFLI